MKIKKLIFVAVISIVSLFAFVSCGEYSVLNDLLRVTNNFQTASVTITSNALTDADGSASELAFTEEVPPLLKLSETTDQLVEFNELRLEIIRLHEELLLQRESIQTIRASIRSSVEQLKELNYIILEGDKVIIQERIETLKTYRDGLLDTRGLAYQRIYELRGTYSRENLANIIVVYQEVIEVLNYRLDTCEYAVIELQTIDTLLLDYLES